MKLCVFQGTFNPIHNAHIQVAEYAYKNLDVDKILFIPAAKPPHKEYNPEMSGHRLNMVKLVVQDYFEFEVSDIEYKLEGKSYTYNTICKLYKKSDIEGRIKFLIGTDAFQYIENWYRADELKELLDFRVFIREDNFESKRFEYLREKGYVFDLMPLDFLDISSTQIREHIKKNLPLADLIDIKVEEYIRKNDLYKD